MLRNKTPSSKVAYTVYKHHRFDKKRIYSDFCVVRNCIYTRKTSWYIFFYFAFFVICGITVILTFLRL